MTIRALAGLTLFFCCGLVSVVIARDEPARAPFCFPCDDYRRGLRGKGNFGVLIKRGSSAFRGSYHLAEDVWLSAGTDVRSIAAGVVRYSDFSPTWTDKAGRVHWNLGNVVVIEHPLDPPEEGVEQVCSVYVHLGADRRVLVGEEVRGGQVIGRIGRDRSEENGRYPAHLHFGIHRGPYHQVSPAWRRELIETARTVGLPAGKGGAIVKGEVEIERANETTVIVRFENDVGVCRLSLLMGSTAPEDPPKDIAAWCSGYGDRETVDEWLKPSDWIEERLPPDQR